jgi:hypothetical protein
MVPVLRNLNWDWLDLYDESTTMSGGFLRFMLQQIGASMPATTIQWVRG